MWLAYKHFQKLLHLIGPSMPITYDTKLERFVEPPRTLRRLWTFYLTNLSVFLVWSVATVRLVAFMQQSSGGNEEGNGNDNDESGGGKPLDFTTFTLDLLYWSLTFQALSTALTFQTKAHCACWLLNQMSLKRRWIVNDIWHAGKSNGSNNILIYMMVSSCGTIPLSVILLPVLFDNTPGHVLIGLIAPSYISSSPLIMSAASGVYQGLTASAASCIQLQVLLLIIIVLLESRYLFRPGYRTTEQWKMERRSAKQQQKPAYSAVTGSDIIDKSKKKAVETEKNADEHEQIISEHESGAPGPVTSEEVDAQKVISTIIKLKMKVALAFTKAYRVYLQAKIIFRVFNQLVFVFFPVAMFVAFTLNVSISFTCIKMFDQLPEIIIAVLLSVNVFVGILTCVFHMAALIITSEYERFEGYWRSTNKSLTRMNQRQFASCQGLNVKIGSLFHLKKSTLPNTFLAILDNLVNLLLLE